MNDIIFFIAAFWRALADHPARLVPFLAYACAATMVIAIVKDAFLRNRQVPEKSRVENKSPPDRR